MFVIRNFRKAYIATNKKLGFVPTMGFLHDGHLSLVRRARKENDIVAVSIYVNPTQFSPNEDFEKYPRDLDRDLSLLREEQVDIVFTPKNKDIYPEGIVRQKSKGFLETILEGKTRETHFSGVKKIVKKFFEIIKPNQAYFGQKDYQQVCVVRKMVHDFKLPVKINMCPTIRENSGLALSSRNIYLSNTDRKKAERIFTALKKAKSRIKNGKLNINEIEKNLRKDLSKLGKVEYACIRDQKTLKPFVKGKHGVILAEIIIGTTRLLDNILF